VLGCVLSLLALHHEHNIYSAGYIYFHKQFCTIPVDVECISEYNIITKYIYHKNIQRFAQRFYIFRLVLAFVAALVVVRKIRKENCSLTKIFVNSIDFGPIFAALILRKIYRCKAQISIFDLPETFATNFFDRFLLRTIFDIVLPYFDYIDVVTQSMANYLRRKNRQFNIFVTHTCCNFHNNDKPMAITNISDTQDLKLVFLGSLRFSNELKLFLKNLDTLKIKYSVITYSNDEYNHPCVVNRGFRAGIIDELRNEYFDYAIVPMSFDRKDMLLVSTSFPSKIATYASADIPMIFLAPDWAAFLKVVEPYDCGIQIDPGSISISDFQLSVENRLSCKQFVRKQQLVRSKFRKFCEET
jgi:hypothetical protein